MNAIHKISPMSNPPATADSRATGGTGTTVTQSTITGSSFYFFFSGRRRHTRCSRDWSQTCALPIYGRGEVAVDRGHDHDVDRRQGVELLPRRHVPEELGDARFRCGFVGALRALRPLLQEDALLSHRSEERRVGNECSTRWYPLDYTI